MGGGGVWRGYLTVGVRVRDVYFGLGKFVFMRVCCTHINRLHESFIKSVPIMSSLNEYERLTIADALHTVAFGPGDVRDA